MPSVRTSLSKVLVTGGTGFIGSHLVALLAERGIQVTALARRGMSVPAGAKVLEADLQDGAAMAALLAADHYDAVFHLAGLNASAGSVALYQANVVGTATLLQVLRALERPQLRLIMAGSSAEYGASSDDPITEDSVCLPVGDYGISKLTATSMGLLLHAATGQAVNVARPFNVIGPGNCTNLLHADVARQIAEVERGERPARIKLRNLSAYRDFVDVRDVAEGFVALAERGEPGQIYNLCTEHAVQAGRLVEILLGMARVPIALEVPAGPRRPDNVPRQCGSFAKAARSLEWQPRRALEKSLTDTLNYWRKAPNLAQVAPFDREIPEAFQR